MKQTLLLFLLPISLVTHAQRALDLQHDGCRTYSLSANLVKTETINYESDIKNYRTWIYDATLVFGEHCFELTVFNKDTKETLWATYLHMKSEDRFVLRKRYVQGPGAQEIYEFVKGDRTYRFDIQMTTPTDFFWTATIEEVSHGRKSITFQGSGADKSLPR